jgi:co-chaperonin GroES (HSP10)
VTKEERLVQLCQEIYEESGGMVQPIYPKVFIRVMPKEQRQGMIWLPDKAQNKPMYEGIVLSVYKPWDEERTKITETGKETIVINHTCSVQIGQRIAFAHYEGMPHAWLDEKKYRFVDERAIVGLIEYEGDKRYLEKLEALFKDAHSVTISGV